MLNQIKTNQMYEVNGKQTTSIWEVKYDYTDWSTKPSRQVGVDHIHC